MSKLTRALRGPIRFAHKTVLITGGSRGLGLCIARQAARRGARVVILAREDATLDRARLDLGRRGANVLAIPCDVTNPHDVEQAVSRAGHVDVAIHCAGRIAVGPMETMSREEMEASMDVHLWGAYNLAQAVLPQMKARGAGRIVNIASIGGLVAVPHLLPYTTSKHALVGWSKGLRAELAKYGIAVTTACPGLMRTGSTRNVTITGGNLEYAWFQLGDSLPLVSMNANRAARKILDACERGSAWLVLTPQAKAVALLDRLLPRAFAKTLEIVEAFLPSRRETPRKATEARNPISESFLVELDRRAARRNNEEEAHPT